MIVFIIHQIPFDDSNLSKKRAAGIRLHISLRRYEPSLSRTDGRAPVRPFHAARRDGDLAWRGAEPSGLGRYLCGTLDHSS